MANPAIKVIEKTSVQTFGETATLSGTIKKTLGLLIVTIASAVAAGKFLPTDSAASYGIMMFAMIGGAILAFVTCFKPHLAEYTTPGYAVFEGVALGMISAVFERMYYGISAIAVATTLVIMFTMLFLWKQRIIVVTEKLRSVIISMTMGIMALYLINFIVSMFWTSFIPRSGIVGIGMTLLIAGIAAFNLLLDFDNIEQAVANGMPKYMEYFNAFGLLMTLVWLYIEILRLVQMIMAMLNNDD